MVGLKKKRIKKGFDGVVVVAKSAALVVAVGYQSAGESLGDVHQFVNEDAFLIGGRKRIEFFGNDFDAIMGVNLEGFLPNGGQAPDAGPGAAGRTVTPEAN